MTTLDFGRAITQFVWCQHDYYELASWNQIDPTTGHIAHRWGVRCTKCQRCSCGIEMPTPSTDLALIRRLSKDIAARGSNAARQTS